MIGKFVQTGQTDLFRMRLDQMVNLKHELIILSKELDWKWIEGELAGYYSLEGRPAIPIRTMVGMLLLKRIRPTKYMLAGLVVLKIFASNQR